MDMVSNVLRHIFQTFHSAVFYRCGQDWYKVNKEWETTKHSVSSSTTCPQPKGEQ